jgi:hypothetical protein
MAHALPEASQVPSVPHDGAPSSAQVVAQQIFERPLADATQAPERHPEPSTQGVPFAPDPENTTVQSATIAPVV